MKKSAKSKFTKILGIDTAGFDSFEILLFNQGKLIRQKFSKKADFLIEKIEKLLKKEGLSIEEIEAVLIRRGPGSFVGLRIGLVFANFFAWFFKKPIFATIKKLEKSQFLNLNKKEPKKFIKPFYGKEFKPTIKKEG